MILLVSVIKLRKSFSDFSDYVASKPLLKKTIVGGLQFIPTVGPILSELFDTNVGNELDKCEKVIEIVKNLKKYNDLHLKNITTSIQDQKKDLQQNTESLNNLVVICDQINKTLEDNRTEDEINSTKIEIQFKNVQWNLLDIKEELLSEIKKSNEFIENYIKNREKEKTAIKKSPKPNPLFENTDYQKMIFEDQLVLFKKQIEYDYAHFKEFEIYRPLISNFKKFDGHNQYVIQNFRDLRTNEEDKNIIEYIEKKIKFFDEIVIRQKNYRLEIEKLEKRLEVSTLKKSVVRLLKTTRPKTAKESEELNRKVEKMSFGHIKIDVKHLKIIKDEKLMLKSVAGKNAVERNKKIHENKLNRIKKILEKPKIIKKQLDDLYAVDFRTADDSLIIKTKKKIEKLEEEKSKLKENSLNQLQNQKAIEKTHGEISEQLSKIIQFEEKINKNRDYVKKLDAAVQEKIQNISQILDESEFVEKSVTRIDNIKKLSKDIEKDLLIPIIGDYGSGKSAVAHKIFVKLCKIKEVTPIFIPLGLLDNHDDLKDHLLLDIFNYIVKEYRFNIQKHIFYELVKTGKMIFVLDALDEISTKLDNEIAQTHLNHMIKLSQTCTVILTSRETYFSEGMRKDLIEYDGLIKITDFTKSQISKFLKFKLGDNDTRINEIVNVVTQERFLEFAQKPLFLDVIQRNFDELKTYLVINESVILEVLTDEWIKHDILIEGEADPDKKDKIILARQKISEILAFEEYYQNGDPIGKKLIEQKVKLELKDFDPEAEERLDEFYTQAITSTFLIYEENESYRFIIKPIMEFFIARRIVSEINHNQALSLLDHIDQISHVEIFDFIRGLIDNDWGVKTHIIRQLQKSKSKEEPDGFVQSEVSVATDFLQTKENLTSNLLEIIRKYGQKSSKYKVSNLIKILQITGNLPPRPNFSNLDLQSIDLRGVNLTKSDLSGANLTNADLSGAILLSANLKHANLTNALLIKSNLNKADLSNTVLVNSNLSYSNLKDVKFNEKTKFQNSVFVETKIDGMNFENHDLTRTKFISVDFTSATLTGANLTLSTIRDSNLKNVNLVDAKLIDSDLRNSNFTYADIRKAKFNRAQMDQCLLIDCVVDTYTILNNAKLIKADVKNTDIMKTQHSGTDFTYALNYGTYYPEN